MKHLNVAVDLPDHPALDQRSLFQEGIERIRQYSGKTWTDHNLHDPGIVLLEAACEAITDIAYRVVHPVEDLIVSTSPQNEDRKSSSAEMIALVRRQFYTPKEALPCAPVTCLDLRRYLMERLKDDVKNIWVTPVDRDYLFLQSVNGPPVRKGASGFFEIDIETFEHPVSDGDAIRTRVLDHLDRIRGLGVRFRLEDIKFLERQQFAFEADLNVEPTVDIGAIDRQIRQQLSDYCSPSLHSVDADRIRDVSQLENAGFPSGTRLPDLLDGPCTSRFFSDRDLLHVRPRRQVRLSDVISILSDIRGVESIRRAEIRRQDANEPATPQTSEKPTTSVWVLDVVEHCVPEFNYRLTYYRNVASRVPTLFSPLPTTQTRAIGPQTSSTDDEHTPQLDDRMPVGRYREVTRAYWQSFITSLPEVFRDRIAEVYPARPSKESSSAGNTQDSAVETPSNALADPTAVFFACFEHLIILLVEQLERAGQLFAWRNDNPTESSENKSIDAIAIRHLIARFNDDTASLLFARSDDSHNNACQLSLQYVNELSVLWRDRHLAQNLPWLDLSRPNSTTKKSPHGFSALERRLFYRLGLKSIARDEASPLSTFLNDSITNKDNLSLPNFSISVEWNDNAGGPTILSDEEKNPIRRQLLAVRDAKVLRVQSSDGQTPRDIRHSIGIGPTRVSMTATEKSRGQQSDEELRQTLFTQLSALFREGIYVIEPIMLLPESSKQVFTLPLDRCPADGSGDYDMDPVSHRLIVVAPAYAGKFTGLAHREWVERTIRTEAPAHLLIRICWITQEQMAIFESCYGTWQTQALASEQREAARKTVVDCLSELATALPLLVLDDPECALGSVNI
jgi:hypothetical protein